MNFDYCKIETAISNTERYILSESHKIGYNLEYDDFPSISEDMLEDVFHPQAPFNEGIGHNLWEAVKAIAKKLLKVLLAIWHSIVNGVKLIFNKIKEFFHGKEDTSTKISKPISLQVPLIENASVKEFKITSKDDLQKVITENIRKIANEINKRSRLQIEGSKRLSSMIDKLSTQPVKEAKVLYNKTVDGTKFPADSAVEKNQFSIQGKDVIDSVAQRDPSRLEKEKLSAILEAKNIVEEYNNYCYDFYLTIGRRKSIDHDTIECSIYSDFQTLCDMYEKDKANFDPSRMVKPIMDEYFDIPDDPQKVKLLIRLKLNYNKKIVQLLSKMLKLNYRILGIEEGEIDNILGGLQDNKKESYNVIYNAIRKNIKQFRVREGFYDFRKIARGVLYMANETDSILTQDLYDPKNLVNLIMQYDCVISTHGGARSFPDNIKEARSNILEKIEIEKKNLEREKENRSKFEQKENKFDLEQRNLIRELKELKRNLNSNKISKEEFNKKAIELSNRRNKLEEMINKIWDAYDKLDEIKRNSKRKIKDYIDILNSDEYRKRDKGWSCIPIRIGNHSIRENVIDVLRDCIADWKASGQKQYRIYCSVCNPGDEKLPKDIMNIPNLTIRMSHKSLKVSNNDYMLWLRQNGDQDSKDYEDKQKSEYGESYTFNSSKFSFLN